MNTLLLFEHEPPGPKDLAELAALAADRGDVVLVCCLPMNPNAYDLPHNWDETVETVRRAALKRGRTVECVFRFSTSRRVLPARLERGDVDLVISAGPLARRMSKRLTEAPSVAGCRAWAVSGGAEDPAFQIKGPGERRR